MTRPLLAAWLAIPLFLAWETPLRAKPPTLTGFFPAGVQRGRSVPATASGTFDHWPAHCWVDGPGLSVKTTDKKGELTFEAAADARPGVRWVRLYDEEGATSPRPFFIGGLPERLEAEPNDDPQKPQAVEPPGVVVNGRLEKTGDVDGFSINLEEGQTLTADLEADRRLKSPMDGVLQIVSTDGFVLAQNDDAVGRDPRIIFKAPAKGTYIARAFAFPSTPDSSIHFSGSAAYVYRLTLSTGGFVEHAFPLGVSRDNPSAVAAVGPNIRNAESVLDLPADDGRDHFAVSNPAFAGAALVRRVSGPVDVEAEPNEPANPQPLADRASVSGRIDPPGDVDAYRIALKKGDKRRFRLESRAFGLPLDGVLQVLDSQGERLAELDDVRDAADPELIYTASADGDHIVVVRDLYHQGGPNHAYLLSVVAPEPEFNATLAADAFTAKPGEKTKVVVTIDRKNEYAESIEVTADDLPEGVAATAAVSNKSGDSAKAVTIELEIKDVARARSAPFRIVARPQDRKAAPRRAFAAVAGFDAQTDRPWLTVLPPARPAK